MENEESVIENNTVNSESERTYFDKVLAVAIEVGCGLLSCGCPVGRVELAVEYICNAYGAAAVSVATFPSMIMAGVKITDGSQVSQLKRVYSISNNFAKMEAYNQLSRDICAKKYPIDEATELVSKLRVSHNPSKLMTALSAGIGAAAFTVFYGGSLIDAIPGGLIGGLMAYLSCIFARLAFNSYARTFMLSLIGGVLSTLMCWLISLTGLTCHLSTVMMGTIMTVIPGLLMCNAIRDLFSGDTYSGTSELLNAVITTLAIVAGYGIPMMVSATFLEDVAIVKRSGVEDYLYRIISCFIGTTAFTVFFGGAYRRLIPSAINAMVTFGVYLVMEAFVNDTLINMLVATAVAAIISEVFARTIKAPAIIFFVPGIILFVPGRTLYLTVNALISKQWDSALTYGAEMGKTLLGIVIGLIVITVLFNLISPTFHSRYLRKRVGNEKRILTEKEIMQSKENNNQQNAVKVQDNLTELCIEDDTTQSIDTNDSIEINDKKGE
ncbi:MAG: threonine/serine exporter ThrE family protein [Candidatus Coproplasma sp.]